MALQTKDARVGFADRLHNSYVSRMVNVTTLAHDIVAAIMDDELPNKITLFDLADDTPAQKDEKRARGAL